MVGSTTVPTVGMDRHLDPAIMSAEAIVYVCIHMHIPYRTAVDGPLCHCVQLSTGHAHVALHFSAHQRWGVIKPCVVQHSLCAAPTLSIMITLSVLCIGEVITMHLPCILLPLMPLAALCYVGRCAENQGAGRAKKRCRSMEPACTEHSRGAQLYRLCC